MNSRARRITGTEAERFWPKVEKDGPVSIRRNAPGRCWVWTAAVMPNGYGRFALTKISGKKPVQVLPHRWCYENAHGPIADNLELDHLCRNPACVNPNHLEAVTHQVNVARGLAGPTKAALQRAKTHCPAGHPYDEANTIVTYRNGPGHPERQCRACGRAASLAYYHRRKSLSYRA